LKYLLIGKVKVDPFPSQEFFSGSPPNEESDFLPSTTVSADQVQSLFPSQEGFALASDEEEDQGSDTNWSDDNSPPSSLPSRNTLQSYLSFQPQVVFQANFEKIISSLQNVVDPTCFPYQSKDTVEFVHLVVIPPYRE
jgi:hypothetical protein